MNKVEFYLNQGKYTNFNSDKVLEISKSFDRTGLGIVIEILSWLHKNIKHKNDQDFKNNFFRKRTALEIIESGFATGCTDYALVFIALMRAQGTPTKYIETLNVARLESSKPDFFGGACI